MIIGMAHADIPVRQAEGFGVLRRYGVCSRREIAPGLGFAGLAAAKPTVTGLGLSIVYGIVRDHGSTIAADSAPGEGPRFVVRLPLPPRSANA